MSRASGKRQSHRNAGLIIVGHGPSVLSGLGAVIDGFKTVVRLKWGLRHDQPPEHFGTRTDVVCARSHLCQTEGAFWHFSGDIEERARRLYTRFGTAKISTGLGAVFCAIEYAKPAQITLIGFDQLLHGRAGKYNDKHRTGFTAHDGKAEMACLKALAQQHDVQIIDLLGDRESSNAA